MLILRGQVLREIDDYINSCNEHDCQECAVVGKAFNKLREDIVKLTPPTESFLDDVNTQLLEIKNDFNVAGKILLLDKPQWYSLIDQIISTLKDIRIFVERK